MSAENNAIMQRLLEELNRGNEDIYDELLSPDYVNHTDPPGRMATREG